MPDAFDENATDVQLSLDSIEAEIKAGLPNHCDRIVRAYINEEYYACRNAAFLQPRESEDWRDFVKRPKRTSKLTRKVVRKLCEHLYAPGPTRTLKNGAAEDSFLQDVYKQNSINAVMATADRKCTLNGAALIGAVATGRPEKPIRLYVWGAHEFVAWSRPDDPTEVWAVVTINREHKSEGGFSKERLVYEAWSAKEHRVYHGEWKDCLPERTPGLAWMCYRNLFCCTATYQPNLSGYSEAGERLEGSNPYGRVPFAVISDETRVSSIYEGGIGDPLRECNAEIDRELTELAAHVLEFMDPDRFLRNVGAKFRREKNRSRWQPLPAVQGSKDGENNLEPDAFLVQAQLKAEEVWGDIKSYADSTIEELDVPLVAIRMDSSTDLSGVAIVGKMLPLLQRTKQRQADPFTQHESDVASLVLMVHGAYYSDARTLAAGSDPNLDLVWPEPAFPLPTPERDAEDQADIDAGRKSLAQVVAERNGMTMDQAWDHLDRVLEDQKRYGEMLKAKGMTPPEPAAAPINSTETPATMAGSEVEDDPFKEPDE